MTIGDDIHKLLELAKNNKIKIYPAKEWGFVGWNYKDKSLKMDWLGAYWVVGAQGDFKEYYRHRTDIQFSYSPYLYQVLPNKKEYVFPQFPKQFRDLDIKEYLKNQIKNGTNSFPHSIISLCSLMYDMVWEVYQTDTRTSPIWYVGQWLKINNVSYTNKHQSFKEFCKESNK